jgi:Rps23 Pro-64 3,4-dihydroxylase Tpa1-like proline 4-hydroxylase
MVLDRKYLAQLMLPKISARLDELVGEWNATPVSHFMVDDLLPEEIALQIYSAFPKPQSMVLKKSLRELKYVAAQMDRHDPILEEIIYAFQEPEIVDVVGRITKLAGLEPDSLLYAGGISLMGRGHFLNPHVDNSHDKSRERYRVLNLLYYVSPNWSRDIGGNLELWPDGPQGVPTTIWSRFNRLVVMVTHEKSWHSVSANLSDAGRCCVSNYYFSKHPVGENDYFHVTSFRGRPEQPIRDLILRGDIWLRSMVRRAFPKGIRDNPHYYKKGWKRD